MLRLPMEETFNEFVEKLGGELVEKALPQTAGEKRADYLFRTSRIIAELKCLERDAFTPDYYQKLQALANGWMARRLLLVYGQVDIELKKLPAQCQTEWLRLLEQPLNRAIVSRANRQIRETKNFLRWPDAKGVLFIANEGNRSLSPAVLVELFA
jgi:hypothetical protein